MSAMMRRRKGKNMDYKINVKTQYYPSELHFTVYKQRNEHPFDASLIPNEYSQYAYNTVDLQTYPQLRKELIQLEIPYEDELEGPLLGKERIIYDENVWESELCYTQGKFLEHVSWIGEQPPYFEPDELYITANVTFRKLDPRELAYYLYWRTEFKKGNYVKGYRACYYLFLYELVVNLGGFAAETTIKYMEALKSHCIPRMKIKSKINRIELEYSRNHEHQNKELFQRPKSKWQEEWEIIPCEIANHNYTHAFEFMDRVATYRLSSSEFVKKIKCKKNIAECIIRSLPVIDKLFQDNDLILSNFLSGIIEKNTLKDSPFVKDTIWTEYTIHRLLLQNSQIVPHRKKYEMEVFLLGDGFRHEVHKQILSIDFDINLIDYILQCCESEFRKELGYEASKIEDPVGYKYAAVSGDFYAMPVEKELRIKWGNYYALYPKIRKIIKKTVQEYFDSKNLNNL